MQGGEGKPEQISKPPEFVIRIQIAPQRGGGGEQHNDGRLDHQRQRKHNAAVGGQMNVGIFQSGHHRTEERKLRAHQQPAGSERQPGANDDALRQR